MEIICLANSFKHQGRCIAGIDRQSGQWVRPISDLDDGRIPIDNWCIPTNRIGILDILDIPVKTGKGAGHEIENVGYQNSPWQILGKAEIINLLQYCEQELLFPDYGRAIPYQYLQSQAPVRTLQLLEVKSFGCHQNSQGKWRGVIADEKYDFGDIELSITDPIALEKLNKGEKLSSHCLICLSLSQPFQKDSNSLLSCYRLIAGVIELLPELELIMQGINRLSWTIKQGRDYLQDKFGKVSRYQLTQAEAREFLSFLNNSAEAEVKDEVIDAPENNSRSEDRTPNQSSRLTEIRKNFPNAYRSWTTEEEVLLVELFRQGKSIEELALEFGRQRGGIRSRLEKLGEIEV